MRGQRPEPILCCRCGKIAITVVLSIGKDGNSRQKWFCDDCIMIHNKNYYGLGYVRTYPSLDEDGGRNQWQLT